MKNQHFKLLYIFIEPIPAEQIKGNLLPVLWDLNLQSFKNKVNPGVTSTSPPHPRGGSVLQGNKWEDGRLKRWKVKCKGHLLCCVKSICEMINTEFSLFYFYFFWVSHLLLITAAFPSNMYVQACRAPCGTRFVVDCFLHVLSQMWMNAQRATVDANRSVSTWWAATSADAEKDSFWVTTSTPASKDLKVESCSVELELVVEWLWLKNNK